MGLFNPSLALITRIPVSCFHVESVFTIKHFLIACETMVAFLLANFFSDLDNPSSLDFHASWNQNLNKIDAHSSCLLLWSSSQFQHIVISGLLIGCGKKWEILRHFQGKLCGKKGLLCGKLCDFFKADLTLFF